MKNLFKFLWKYYFFFLFILLEMFSILLFVRSSGYQRSVIVNSTNEITGGILGAYSYITDYFSLRRANRILAEENADFYNRLPQAYIQTDTAVFFMNDTLYRRQYRYFSAQVISNTINRRNNRLVLNKGSVHGVEKDMAVVAPRGIVGQVVGVSGYFCSVMSVLNSRSRISVKLKSSQQIGTLSWNGENYRIGTLTDIPSHVIMHEGDTVVTSGFSHIFPEGVNVGVVEDFHINPGDHFYTASIKYFVDYNSVYHVFIVQNLLRDELDELEKNEKQ